MPIDANRLSTLPPTVRREFDVTGPEHVDLLAFFVEHPDNAYNVSEIQQLVEVCSNAYANIPTSERNRGTLEYKLKSCVKMGLLKAASDQNYYYLIETEAAKTLLDVAGWRAERDVDGIVHYRGTDQVSFKQTPLSQS